MNRIIKEYRGRPGIIDKICGPRKIRESVPDWLDKLGEKEVGKGWTSILASLNKPPKLILRTNTLKTNREILQTKLKEEGVETDALDFVSDALEARAAKNTYLSHAGRGGETVPTGNERTAINAAIQGLIDAVETKAGENGNVLLFNREGFSPLPESQWLSVGVIQQAVEQLVQPFHATQIPVRVIDALADAGIVANPDDGVASGVTFKGRIHLIREGLADTSAVERTFWHDLLHFGLRRFMTRDQYIMH